MLTLKFDGSDISIYKDSENRAWFLAQDVLATLGLSTANATKFLDRHVSSDFKKLMAVGIGRPSWYVAEPGAYQLIFNSKSQKALEFQRWVFEEVLPAIRKDGGYISPSATKEQLEALQKQVDIYGRAFWNMAHAQTSNRTVEKEIDKVRFLLPGVSEPVESAKPKEIVDELAPTLDELFNAATRATIQRKLYNSAVSKSDFIKTAQHLGFTTPKSGLINLKASQIDFLIKEAQKTITD